MRVRDTVRESIQRHSNGERRTAPADEAGGAVDPYGQSWKCPQDIPGGAMSSGQFKIQMKPLVGWFRAPSPITMNVPPSGCTS